MAAAPYEMDAGGVATGNCFPARSVFRTGHGGAGRWLLSQKTPQGRGIRMVVCPGPSEEKRRSEIAHMSRRRRSCPPERTRRPPDSVLDSEFLMKVHHVKDPSDLCAVDVSDKHLTAARTEEFVWFNNVAYINAAENTLTLESFRTFLQLRELELPMNGIQRIKIKPGDFPLLEVLDLSYNSLSPGDITQLGVLPRLRVLYLSGNELNQLPPDLTAPPPNDEDMTMFPCLNILMLDDNRLSHPAVFVSLAGLKSLRLLNLDSNGITSVPYLHQSDSCLQGGEAEYMDTEVKGYHHKTTVMRDGDNSLPEGMEEMIDYMVLPSTKDPDRTEVIFPSIQSAVPSDPLPKPPQTSISSSILPSFLRSSTEELIQSFSPPLPSLTTLSLADNKIAHEEDLLAAALFPSLEEIVIHGNPLTTHRKDPHLLKSFLQQRLGVKITWKKMAAAKKPHLVIPNREKRKVSTHVPKIPKRPLMIEPPLHPFLRLFGHESDITEHMISSSPLPPIRTSLERMQDTARGWGQEFCGTPETSEEQMSFGSEPAVESVFMTQVDDLLDSPPCSSSVTAHEEQDVNISQNLEHTEIPEKFRGYKEFYHVKTDPDFIEPVGIQNNVRALEYALKHLLVYHNCEPRQGSIQKPHIPRESQLEKELHPSPWKSKKEVLADVLTSMRGQRHLVEVPLESALGKNKTSREHREARGLMKDLHRRYKFLHSEAVKWAAELEDDLKNTAKELLEAQGKLGDIHRKDHHGL